MAMQTFICKYVLGPVPFSIYANAVIPECALHELFTVVYDSQPTMISASAHDSVYTCCISPVVICIFRCPH